MRRSNIARLAVLFVILAVSVGLYLYFPDVKNLIKEMIGAVRDPTELEKLVVSYRASAPLVILGLTILQAVITFLPLCAVMIVSTMVMGFFWGVTVCVACQLIVGYLTMLLTRYFSRPLTEKFRDSKQFTAMSDVIQRNGSWGVLVARLLPFSSFDLVNFAAGLLNVKDRDFLLGTLIGVIPATCLYGAIGANLYSLDGTRSNVYYLISGISIAVVVVIYLFVKKRDRMLSANDGDRSE